MSYTIEQVSQLFEATLVPQHQKQAQETLLAAAFQPGFFQILLQVRQPLSALDIHSLSLRSCATPTLPSTFDKRLPFYSKTRYPSQ